MAKVLDKTSKTVLVKLTIKEYQILNNAWVFNNQEDKLDDYEFVFDEPVKASVLLKCF